VALASSSCAQPPDSPVTEVATLDADGRITIPAGRFIMGTNTGASYEGPARAVFVARFAIDRTEATNAEFAAFVSATRYVTTAERVGSSSVFADSTWQIVDGATWRTPEGPASTVEGRATHPVVQLSYDDAQAYCRSRGGRIPREAEWERAARGGLERAMYPWGDEPPSSSELRIDARANTWQGRFPIEDRAEDGAHGTAPVGSYRANGLGLFDVAGNAWEWTDTELEPGVRVIRGGSWLCSESHCVGYRVAARGRAMAGEGANHLGVRCAYDAQ
jgi:formylglycine-generating enzyme